MTASYTTSLHVFFLQIALVINWGILKIDYSSYLLFSVDIIFHKTIYYANMLREVNAKRILKGTENLRNKFE